VLIIAEPMSRVAMIVVSRGRRTKVIMLTRGSRVRRWTKPNRASPMKPMSMRAAVLVEAQPQSAPREMAMSRPVRARQDLPADVLLELFGGALVAALKLTERGQLGLEEASAAAASVFLDGARAR
jgi:hypothetical protein